MLPRCYSLYHSDGCKVGAYCANENVGIMGESKWPSPL